MLYYNLDSLQSAEKLVRLCEKYRDEMELDIDIIYGRQTIDGCSLLGVASLIGKFVTVSTIGRDKEKIKRFEEELERIKNEQ